MRTLQHSTKPYKGAAKEIIMEITLSATEYCLVHSHMNFWNGHGINIHMDLTLWVSYTLLGKIQLPVYMPWTHTVECKSGGKVPLILIHTCKHIPMWQQTHTHIVHIP